MSKSIFALTVSTLLFFQTNFATDRIVEENGLGGTAYTTISAAYTASVSGDLIMVFPRQGGESYMGTLTSSSKTGIRIRCAVPGQRFKMGGDIFANTGYEISGAEITGNIYCKGTMRVTGCKLLDGDITTNGINNLPVYIDNDSVMNGFVHLYKGRVSGCFIEATLGEEAIQLLNPTTATTETVDIVGNHLRTHHEAAMHCVNDKQYLNLSNNYVEMFDNTLFDNLYVFNIQYTKSVAGGVNKVCNNTVRQQSSQGVLVVFNIATGQPNMDVENNVLSVSATTYAVTVTGNAFINFKYNYYTGLGPSQAVADGTNMPGAFISMNPATGMLAVTSDGIDGGNPSDAYKDIDLTRNDAGCYGGSYSRANFTVAETTARVLFMNAPRTVPTNVPFAISAEGIHK